MTEFSWLVFLVNERRAGESLDFDECAMCFDRRQQLLAARRHLFGLQLRPFGVTECAGTKCPLRRHVRPARVWAAARRAQPRLRRSRRCSRMCASTSVASRVSSSDSRSSVSAASSACAARMRGLGTTRASDGTEMPARPPRSRPLRGAARPRATRCRWRRGARQLQARFTQPRLVREAPQFRAALDQIAQRRQRRGSRNRRADLPTRDRNPAARLSREAQASGRQHESAPAALSLQHGARAAPPRPRGAPNPASRRHARVAPLRDDLVRAA